MSHDLVLEIGRRAEIYIDITLTKNISDICGENNFFEHFNVIFSVIITILFTKKMSQNIESHTSNLNYFIIESN